jgi:hypothetical protein
MKRLVEFPMDDGTTILVEVDEPGYAGSTLRSMKPGDMIERAGMTYEQAIGRIQPAASSIIARLRDMPEPPTEIAVELGISLSAEAGAFLASAATQAHLIITLTWKAPKLSAHSESPPLPMPESTALPPEGRR